SAAASAAGRGHRGRRPDLRQTVRLHSVLSDVGGRAERRGAGAGPAHRPPAGALLGVRPGFPDGAVGRVALLCRDQPAGAVGAAAGADHLPGAGVVPAAADRPAAPSAPVPGLFPAAAVAAGWSGSRGRGAASVAGPSAAGPARLRLAGVSGLLPGGVPAEPRPARARSKNKSSEAVKTASEPLLELLIRFERTSCSLRVSCSTG